MAAEATVPGAAPGGEPMAARPDAIFILGMLPRTGTNHLADLFEVHEQVTVLKPVFEDHLVQFSPLLAAYVEQVTRQWSPDWGVPADEPAKLFAGLGDGIVSWLRSHDPGRTIVTKMPRVDGIGHFLDLFPTCGLVILARDGRSVVESGVRTFGWSYEAGFRRWNTAAEAVLSFQDRHRGDPRVQLVRYEDLIGDEPAVMRRLFEVFGLDAGGFDASTVAALPVRGSSTLAGSGEVHWAPVERSASFDPRERWRDWDAHLHRRFNAVAGASQQRLGYAVETVRAGRAPRARLSASRDAARERYEEFRRSAVRVVRAGRHLW